MFIEFAKKIKKMKEEARCDNLYVYSNFINA